MRLTALLQRLVFILTVSFIFVTPAFAQTNPALTPNTNPDVPKNLHNWTQNVMIEVMAALSCQLTGIDPVNPKQQCLGVDSKSGKIGFVPSANQGQAGGAIGAMGNIIAFTYTPALHTGDYFGYLAQNFGIAKPAYAQRTGAGFDSLNPIINLWIAFRNLVYLLFVAVFAIVGFGIMLRINIDPRTVMTIANQLPKMIVAILLVTFSFAISGFLIDIMWASIYVTTNVITSSGSVSQETAQKIVQSASPFEAANALGEKNGVGGLTRIADEPASSLGTQATPIFDNTGGRLLTGAITGFLSYLVVKKAGGLFEKVFTGIGGLIGTAVNPGVGTVAGSIIGGTLGSLVAALFVGTNVGVSFMGGVVIFIAFIVIAIAILWALFRLMFQLVISYVTILIHAVLAPFWIVGGLFPGSPIGFGAWFREMLGSLSVFPVTIGMFLLGRIFMTAFDKNVDQFAPPMTGNPNAGSFGAFIGLGIILLTPQVVTIMKDLFKSPQFKHGGAIAQPLAFGLGAVNVPQHAQKLATMWYYRGFYRQLPIIGSFFGKEGVTTEQPRAG